LTNLKLLGLEGTKISDSGLVHLQSLSTLEDINLDGTNITSAGLKKLKNLSKLKTISAAGVKITKSDRLELQKALPDCLIDRPISFVSTMLC
jgi:internalin A